MMNGMWNSPEYVPKADEHNESMFRLSDELLRRSVHPDDVLIQFNFVCTNGQQGGKKHPQDGTQKPEKVFPFLHFAYFIANHFGDEKRFSHPNALSHN